jgi:hypothetical protein
VRAQTLCEQLNDTPKLLTVLVSLQRFYAVQGEVPKAGKIGERLMSRIPATEDKTLPISAYRSLGIHMFYTDYFVQARTLFEEGAAQYTSTELLSISLDHS